MTPERVREPLLATIGRQACQRPEDWPVALKHLMEKRGNGGPDSRGSYTPRVEAAVDALVQALRHRAAGRSCRHRVAGISDARSRWWRKPGRHRQPSSRR
jgi:hypothetical protein